MKLFNNNRIYSLDPWTIFSVFSTTETLTSKKFNVTTSLFFTGLFKLNLHDELSRRLYYNGIFCIFDLDENSLQPITTKIDVGDGKNLIIYQGTLNSLLENDQFFKCDDFANVLNKSAFIFHNYRWTEICTKFSDKDIFICGGSSTRRHILAPIHLKLMTVLTNFDFTYQDVVSSFNDISKLKQISLPKGNLNPTKTYKLKQSKNSFNSPNGTIYSYSTLSSLGWPNGGATLNNIFKIKNYSTLSSSNKDLIKDNIKNSTTPCSPSTTGQPFILNESIPITQNVHAPLEPGGKDSHFSFYLETIKSIISVVEDNLTKGSSLQAYSAQLQREAQLKLEESWLKILKEKLNEDDNVENIRHKLPNIFKTSKSTLEIAYHNGDLKRRFKNLLNEMNNPEFLLLTLGYIISQFKFNKRNVIAMSIANNILYEIFKSKKSQFKDFKSFKIYYGYYNEKLEKDDLTKVGRLGTYFMYLFINDPTSIFSEEFAENDFDSDISLQINPEYTQLVRDEIMLHPKSIPMICQPNPWGKNLYGGFLENEFLKESIITGSSYHKHNMKNKDNLYNAVNYFNSIKFSINNDLLNYLNTHKGELLINLLDNLKLKAGDKDISESEKLQRNITLKLAEIYKNIPFYLNTHADWRGRIYTHSFFISYQGGDLSSAVLQFFDGESLTESGLEYFYIHGANCYGKDGLGKKVFADRIKWVKENTNKIIELDPEFIASAESPYKFLAFSLALSNLQKDPNAIIKLPVWLDATCSGIQHLSGLLADFTLGSNVNLVPSENISDIYSSLLKPINHNINKFGKENLEFQNLSTIKLTRKIIKRPIMTKVYNVSILGIKDQLISEFKKINLGENTIRYEAPGINGYVLLNNAEVLKIASIINKTIFTEFPSLKTIYDYFLEIVRLMVKIGIPIVWFTPSGLEITQSYLKSDVYKVSINIRGKSKKMVLKDWKNEIDTIKQVNAIIPNIIHSLDASHLVNLINSAINNKFTPILGVHDCFGTHPNRMDNLSYEVKKEFILLYSNPTFLESFHNRLIQSIKDNNFIIEKDTSSKGLNTSAASTDIVIVGNKKLKIPIYPKIGKLEIKNIINSKYMIM